MSGDSIGNNTGVKIVLQVKTAFHFAELNYKKKSLLGQLQYISSRFTMIDTNNMIGHIKVEIFPIPNTC